jgi:hypothetical protein
MATGESSLGSLEAVSRRRLKTGSSGVLFFLSSARMLVRR